MDIQPIVNESSQVKPRSPKKKIEIKIPHLNLPEKLFVLTIEDGSGVIPSGIKAKLRYALIGALFSELVLGNRIRLEDGRLLVNDPGSVGNAWFDEFLTQIASDQKSRKINYWFDTFDKKEIVNKLAERLAERNVITIEKKHYLWIIPCEVFPKINASGKYSVKQQLRSICLAGEKADFYNLALLNLLKECQMLNLVFTRDERKSVVKTVKRLFHDETAGENNSKLLADIKDLGEVTAGFANA